jgi:adenylate cyclase
MSDELVQLVGALSRVRMDEYAVVGSYTRFDERLRQRLKDAQLRIAEACREPARRRDNHLVWAAPGSGKTYFVEQVAASLGGVEYRELNLAKLGQQEFRAGLEQAAAGGPVVCLVDEVDARPEEPWPYELLLPFLDLNLERGGGFVFALAGSSGSTIEEFKDEIAGRPKGRDLLSRVPEANEWVISPMDAGDRILVALSQMLNAAADAGRPLAAVEKLALYYLAAAPHLGNARQLREFAVRAVARGSVADDRIRYDDLFDSGDAENKQFWAGVMPAAEDLVDSFVRIERQDGDRAAPSEEGTRAVAGATEEPGAEARRAEGEPRGAEPAAPPPKIALSLPAKPSIAVLPFDNMSADAEHEFFADGIVEDIITELSRLRWLFVIARNSSFTYKGQHVDVRRVGSELGVRYVLEGSVRTGGNRIRVTAQLVDAQTGSHLWAERYDRGLEDVFAVQDEITESVIGCIQPELYAAEHDRVTATPPQSLHAWENFVRAMVLYSQHSNASTREALELLEAALAADSNYAQAHGLRAVCLAWRAFQGWEEREEAFRGAAEAADRAVLSDPDEPWAFLARGFIAVARRRDAEAVEAFGRATVISPSFAYAYGLLGAAHALAGRPDEAIPCIERGLRLSPRDTFGEEFQLYYAFAHFQAGRYREAASAAQSAIRLRPGHPVPYMMAAAARGLEDEIEDASELAAQLLDLVPGASAADIEQNFLYCHQDDRSRLARGLRAAGLPD